LIVKGQTELTDWEMCWHCRCLWRRMADNADLSLS